MAQPDAQQSSHGGAIDAHAHAEKVHCCAVCMEPAGWVAAGPCGHREVCVNCAVLLRFFRDDRRCCICRALCPTVIITRSDDRGQQQDDAAGGGASFVKPPASMFTGAAGRAVGKYFWYHGGMAAYFDDREQYEAARKACSLKKTSGKAGESSEAPADQSSRQCLGSCVLFSVGGIMLTVTAGLLVMCVARFFGLFGPLY